jgi:alkanesulfonate monooxygenase SsuD/methylene tetrahydromethanopterin reductase-like flavin-dependent oxidoreductase (luciferase family)
MVMTAVRFNCIQPGLEPKQMSDRYRAFVDMAGYADEHGASMVTLEEHHGAENGWSPSPLVMAGLVFGRTKNIGVTISALLLPLHDPLRVAEDIAVLDLASGGRITTIFGLGYRPEEYAAHGKDWSKRGALFDEGVDAVLKGWTGEPFEYHGTTVRVTPTPLTQPHPMVLLGGTSKPAARRAARFGLPFFPAANMPDLEAYYYEQCTEHGTQGFCMMPGEETVMLHVSEDPERAWEELGQYFLHEASTYASWQTPDIHSAVHSHAKSVDDLRAEGIYQVLAPDEVVERLRGEGEAAACNLHPLVGGMPIDEGWECLRLYVEQVLPEVSSP